MSGTAGLDETPSKLAPRASDAPANLAFVAWASAAFLVLSVTMLLICRHVTGGRIVYVVDDAAIHLSVARTLLQHGTWGVRPGVYESVSSSPLWGLLLTAAMWATRTRDILPWALNVLAGVWLIWAVGSRQQVLRPSRRAPLSVLATIGLVLVVLFMPSLTMVGMEHLLHCAMVVQLVAWIHDRAIGRRTGVPRWAPYLLASLAVLTRFETMWVVAGLGLGYLVDGWVRDSRDRSERRVRLRTVVGLGVATGVPVAAYAAINRAMGQGFLPNSVIAKSIIAYGGKFPITAKLVIERLNTDPLISVLLIGAIGYLVVGGTGRSRQSIVPAVTFVVAVVVHSVLAQYSYFERYQAYLIAIGVYFAFSVGGEILPDRKKAVALLALAALVVAPVKWNFVVLTPRGAEDTYAQRYQAALFLKRYYQLRPIATGELGYISLIHDGPITDLLGLGDYEVLQRRKKLTDTPAFYADLARRRQFPVVVDYSGTLGPSANRTPATWFLVAEWRLQATPVSALPELFQFWATTGGAAVELKADLEQNASRLPGGVHQVLNDCLDAELERGGSGAGAAARILTPGGPCVSPNPPK